MKKQISELNLTVIELNKSINRTSTTLKEIMKEFTKTMEIFMKELNQLNQNLNLNPDSFLVKLLGIRK